MRIKGGIIWGILLYNTRIVPDSLLILLYITLSETSWPFCILYCLICFKSCSLICLIMVSSYLSSWKIWCIFENSVLNRQWFATYKKMSKKVLKWVNKISLPSDLYLVMTGADLEWNLIRLIIILFHK